jgi:hypothetical protein
MEKAVETSVAIDRFPQFPDRSTLGEILLVLEADSYAP